MQQEEITILKQKLQEVCVANNISKIRLFILTPCYGGQMGVNYVKALIETRDYLIALGVEVFIEFCKSDSLVTRARNNLVAKAMNNLEMTHVIFIDSDIGWLPQDVLRLIFADKGLVGGIYPLKSYSWNKLCEDKLCEDKLCEVKLCDNKVCENEEKEKEEKEKEEQENKEQEIEKIMKRHQNSILKDKITPLQFLRHNMVKYNVNFLSSQLQIVNSLVEVRHIPTGFMMIKRNTLEKMMTTYHVTKYTDDIGFLQGVENNFAYALFDCAVINGHYYSEDWLFCHRWMEMGEKIYMDVGIGLTHTGQEDYSGFILSSLV